jgi:hypothetical protein
MVTITELSGPDMVGLIGCASPNPITPLPAYTWGRATAWPMSAAPADGAEVSKAVPTTTTPTTVAVAHTEAVPDTHLRTADTVRITEA